jgi:hypothetical protein
VLKSMLQIMALKNVIVITKKIEITSTYNL